MSAPEVEKPETILAHVYRPGARFHVISYSTSGRRCSEPACEVNHPPMTEKPAPDVDPKAMEIACAHLVLSHGAWCRAGACRCGNAIRALQLARAITALVRERTMDAGIPLLGMLRKEFVRGRSVYEKRAEKAEAALAKLDTLGKKLCALVPAIMDALESDSNLDQRRAAFESIQDFFDDPDAQKWHPRHE